MRTLARCRVLPLLFAVPDRDLLLKSGSMNVPLLDTARVRMQNELDVMRGKTV
jgi:hypothetical protein